MQQSFSIRKVKAADGKDLVRNFYSYYGELRSDPRFGLLLPEVKPTRKDELAWFDGLLRRVRNGSTIASVAEEKGRVVGICEVVLNPWDGRQHTGDLGMAVEQGHRDRGIGTALVKDVIEKCKDGLELIRLAVINDNAKRFYRRLGFRRYGILKRAVKRGDLYLDREFMVLNLRK